MLLLGACWSRHFWEKNTTNEAYWTKKESAPHFLGKAVHATGFAEI
jgi:hypothetical protein